MHTIDPERSSDTAPVPKRRKSSVFGLNYVILEESGLKSRSHPEISRAFATEFMLILNRYGGHGIARFPFSTMRRSSAVGDRPDEDAASTDPRQTETLDHVPATHCSTI